MTDPLLDDAPFVRFLGESLVVSITVGVDLVFVFESASGVVTVNDGGDLVVVSVSASVVVSATDDVASEIFCYCIRG